MIICHRTLADATNVIKYGFKIKTRSGTVVDNLVFAARDRADAERKVTQIYHQCEILDCQELQQMAKEEWVDLEGAINLINQESGPKPPAATQGGPDGAAPVQADPS
jgi:hypothetical protein